MKMLYKAVAAAFLVTGLYAEVNLHHEYVARINNAIDQRDVAEVDKLTRAVSLSLAEKDRFLASARKWVEFYEHKTKSWFKSGNDLAQFSGGLAILVLGLAVFQQSLHISNEQTMEEKNKGQMKYLMVGSLGCDALGIWLITRGWRKAHAFNNLSKARRILEILEISTVLGA
jgi:hypothetical protein